MVTIMHFSNVNCKPVPLLPAMIYKITVQKCFYLSTYLHQYCVYKYIIIICQNMSCTISYLYEVAAIYTNYNYCTEVLINNIITFMSLYQCYVYYSCQSMNCASHLTWWTHSPWTSAGLALEAWRKSSRR